MHGDLIPAKKDVRGDWKFYICSVKKSSRGQRCDARRIGARKLEKAVIDSLLTLVLTRDNLRPIANAIEAETIEATNSAETSLAVAREALAQVVRQIDNLTEAIADIGLSPSLKQKLTDRERERETLWAQIAHNEHLLSQAQANGAITDALLDDWVADMRAAITAGGDVARRAIRQFVDKIVLKGDVGEIFYTFPRTESVDRLGKQRVDLRGFEPLTSTVRL